MVVLFTKRVVKVNTHSTEKFAPRSANQELWHLSGPFSSLKAGQRAALAALGQHTCLSAIVVSDRQAGAFIGRTMCSEGPKIKTQLDAMLDPGM